MEDNNVAVLAAAAAGTADVVLDVASTTAAAVGYQDSAIIAADAAVGAMQQVTVAIG